MDLPWGALVIPREIGMCLSLVPWKSRAVEVTSDLSHPHSSVSPARSHICFQLLIPNHSEVEATLGAQRKHHTLPGVLAAAGGRQ